MFEQWSYYWMELSTFQCELHTYWIGHSSIHLTSLLLINRTLRWAVIEHLTERLPVSASGLLDHYTTDETYKIMQLQLAV